MSDSSDHLKGLDLPSERHPILNNAPNLSELVELLGPLENWEKFATYLPGIAATTIEEIKQKRSQKRKQKEALFSRFCQLPTPSWDEVTLALIKSNEISIACSVLQNYKVKNRISIRRLEGNKILI